ncbi:DNA ligase [uncultured archaeon]|nr:DNA ligase [uncultured archaeon]
MLYSQVARALQEVSSVSRDRKVEICAALLKGLEPRMLCPVVRLLTGELWPPWEEREMGVGPEALMAALSEVSPENVSVQRESLGEMGLVAEAALQKKGQHSLFREPLQALAVYERLRRVSEIRGPDSEHRKNALLRGLFLEAEPLEAKYIARTALRNMLAGLGARTMVLIIALVSGRNPLELQRAYNLMPDAGLLASATLAQGKEKVAIEPLRPIKPMVIRSGGPEDVMLPGAFLPVYSGLKVQVHKTDNAARIFTSQLHNIAPVLNGLALKLCEIEADFIVDAYLIGFQEDRICSQAEMLRYINRRRLSRRRSITPALQAYDLIYLDGEDVTRLPYTERRDRLVAALGEPVVMPFSGISSVPEERLSDRNMLQQHLERAKRAEAKGLLARDPGEAYLPGNSSDRDFLIGAKETIAVMIVRAEYGRGIKKGLLSRYCVAVRHDGEMVSVGCFGGLTYKEAGLLSDHLKALAMENDELGVVVTPSILLNLSISGVRKVRDGYVILRPRIEEIRFDATAEEADELVRLERIYLR